MQTHSAWTKIQIMQMLLAKNAKYLRRLARGASEKLGSTVRLAQTKTLPRPTEEEAALIQEFRQELASLGPLPSGTVDGVDDIWLNFRREFRRLFAVNDPRGFLKWDLTRHCLYNPAPHPGELSDLMSLPTWSNRWRPAIRESKVGLPEPCPALPETSWNLVHHAFALAHFERASGLHPEEFAVILEFGGGYGSMARLCWQLGFRGTYIIYDLPEMCAIQRYYLGSLGLPTSRAVGYQRSPTFTWVSTIEALRRILPEGGADLFLATWSLSETSIRFRENFLENLKAKHFLIVFADKYCGIDNASFFREWQKRNGNLAWDTWHSHHLRGRSYLVGVPRSHEPINKQ